MGLTVAFDLNKPCTHSSFAAAVGVSPPRVTALIAAGVLKPGETAGEWLKAYCAQQRDAASGHAGDLQTERAALTREQTIGQKLKNEIAFGEYAPISLLMDTLANASASIASRFDGLRPQLRRRRPNLTEEDLDAIELILSDARTEWSRATAELVTQRVDDFSEDDDDEDEK